MKTFIASTITVIAVALMLWILISWMDVLMHNDPWTGDRQYHNWNAFMLLTEVEP